MSSDSDCPRLVGSDDDDFSDIDDDFLNSDNSSDDEGDVPNLIGTEDDEYVSEEEEHPTITTWKEIARKWIVDCKKREKSSFFSEFMRVLKIKILGPIIFGQEENLTEPWLDALLRFKVSQNTRSVPIVLLTEESIGRVIDAILEFFTQLLNDESRLGILVDFGRRLAKHDTDGVNSAMQHAMRNNSDLSELQTKILRNLETGRWPHRLGGRPEQKVTLVILVAVIHYSHFIEAWIKERRSQVADFEQSVKSDFEKVKELHAKGNSQFSEIKKRVSESGYKTDYRKPVTTYTEALKKAPYHFLIFGNRSQCNLEMRRFHEAKADAFRAVVIQPSWAKGNYRWAEIYMELKDLETAKLISKEAVEKCKLSLINKDRDISDLQQQNARFFIDRSKEAAAAAAAATAKEPSPSEGKKKLKKAAAAKRPPTGPAPALSSSEDNVDDDDMPGLLPADGIDSDDPEYEDPIQGQRRKKKKGKAKYSSPSKSKKDYKTNRSGSNNFGAAEAPNAEAASSAAADNAQSVADAAPASAPLNAFEVNERLRRQLKEYLSAGSMAILNEVSRSAVNGFEKALEFVDSHERKALQFEDIDEAILKYAMAVAHIDSGVETNITKAIESFKDLAECPFSNYPFAFLGVGRGYEKLNFFSLAVPWLERGLEAVQRGVKITGGVSYWPGTEIVIEETRPGRLKELLGGLLDRCKNPPPPNARCVYEDCKESKREIYFNDIPFNGHVTLQCRDNCHCDFHRSCWTRFKGNSHKSNKDYLGKECMTPDCGALIIEYRMVDHTTVEKVKETWNGAEEKKEKSPTSTAPAEGAKSKTRRVQPSKENLKLRREKKEEKKKQKMAAKGKEGEVKVEETEEEMEKKEKVEKEEEKESESAAVALPAMEEMVVLKSKNEEEENSSTFNKKKKHKNKDKNKPEKMNIEINFVDEPNRWLQSENNLPRHLSESPIPFNISSSSDSTAPAYPFPSTSFAANSFPPSFPLLPSPSLYPESASGSVTLSQESHLSGSSARSLGLSSTLEEAESSSSFSGVADSQQVVDSNKAQIVESIIVWCEQILDARGPVLVADLDQLVNTLSTESQEVLADEGGLGQVLGRDANKRCLILLDEDKKEFAYYAPDQFEFALRLFLNQLDGGTTLPSPLMPPPSPPPPPPPQQPPQTQNKDTLVSFAASFINPLTNNSANEETFSGVSDVEGHNPKTSTPVSIDACDINIKEESLMVNAVNELNKDVTTMLSVSEKADPTSVIYLNKTPSANNECDGKATVNVPHPEPLIKNVNEIGDEGRSVSEGDTSRPVSSLLTNSFSKETMIEDEKDSISQNDEEATMIIFAPDTGAKSAGKTIVANERPPSAEAPSSVVLPKREKTPPLIGLVRGRLLIAESAKSVSENGPLAAQSASENAPIVLEPLHENSPLVSEPLHENSPLVEESVREKSPLVNSDYENAGIFKSPNTWQSRVKEVTSGLSKMLENVDGNDNVVAGLELAADKALITISPLLISVGSLHFEGSSEQMTITRVGINFFLNRDRMSGKTSASNQARVVDWPIRVFVKSNCIKRCAGNWERDPARLFFALTSAGGKSVAEKLAISRNNINNGDPLPYDPDSYDNSKRWITVTFSPQSFNKEDFELIFKYISYLNGYGLSAQEPGILKRLSDDEVDSLSEQALTPSNRDRKDAIVPTEPKTISQETMTSLTGKDLTSLENLKKVNKELEAKGKTNEAEIRRLKDELAKRDNEKKKAEKEVSESKKVVAQKSCEIVELNRRKSESEKKLQTKISEKEKELTSQRNMVKELEDRLATNQQVLEDAQSNSRVVTKECFFQGQMTARRSLQHAIDEHAAFESFLEERLKELDTVDSEAKMGLMEALRDSVQKKQELRKNLDSLGVTMKQVEAAVKEGRSIHEELKKVSIFHKAELDRESVFKILLEHRQRSAVVGSPLRRSGLSADVAEFNRAGSGDLGPSADPVSGAASMENAVDAHFFQSMFSPPAPAPGMLPHRASPILPVGFNAPSVTSPLHLPPGISTPLSRGVPPVGQNANSFGLGPHLSGLGLGYPEDHGPYLGANGFGTPLNGRMGVPSTLSPMTLVNGTSPGPMSNGHSAMILQPPQQQQRRATPTPPAAAAAAPAAPAPPSRRPLAGIEKLIHELKQLHPGVDEGLMKYHIAEVRREKGGKLSGTPMHRLVEEVSAKLRGRTDRQPATRYVPPASLQEKHALTMMIGMIYGS